MRLKEFGETQSYICLCVLSRKNKQKKACEKCCICDRRRAVCNYLGVDVFELREGV